MSDHAGGPATVVHRHWPCVGRVTGVEAVATEHGINSSNVVVTAAGPAGPRRYVLKEVSGPEEHGLRRAGELQRFAFCRDIPVPEMILCTEPAGMVARDAGRAYTLQAFCEGHEFDGRLESATALAVALARLHVVLREAGGDLPDRPGYRDLDRRELATIEATLAGQRSAWERVARRVVQVLPSLYTQMDGLDEDEFPTQPVHIDCNRKNVLFRTPRDPVILDFGSIIPLPRMQAVAFACHRFVGFSRRRVRRFLGAYDEIDPLTPGEARQYPLFVSREALGRVNFVLRSHFFDGFFGWDFELARQFRITLRALTQAGLYGEVLS